MNKAEVIEKIVEQTSLSKGDVEKVVASFFDTIKNSLSSDESVKLIGFGTFSRNERKARTGRNPKTGEDISIAACFYPKFKPGKEFKAYLNK